MHPLKPMECAPTAVETGHPGLVGPGGNWGSRCQMQGKREAVGFLTQTDSAEAPPPPTAPQRLPSSWVRTCCRYVPGRAGLGWEAGPCRLSV